jgi:hypothetical protein
MSPSVGNFVTDLVEMAKATERLPLIEAELNRANSAIEDYAKQVQALELRAIDRKNEIDALHARIHELEVQRDDAELRFLELDEKAGKSIHLLTGILDDLKNAGSEITRSIDFISPLKPMPEPIAEVVQSIQKVHTEVPAEVPQSEPEWRMDHTQGQSEADPTPNVGSGESLQEKISATSSVTKAVTLPSPEQGKYSGLRYYDHKYYVPLSSWLAGGGTEEDYNWRPTPEVPNLGVA